MMTYEQMMAMIGQGTEAGNLQDELAMQMKQADAMRTGAPEMRSAGRVMVAPHMLEYLGGMAKNRVAGQLDQKALQGQGKVRGLQQQQFADFLRAMSQQGPQQGMQMPGPMPDQSQAY